MTTEFCMPCFSWQKEVTWKWQVFVCDKRMPRVEKEDCWLFWLLLKKHGGMCFSSDGFQEVITMWESKCLQRTSGIPTEEENRAKQKSIFVLGRNTVPVSGGKDVIFGTGTKLTVIPCKSFAI